MPDGSPRRPWVDAEMLAVHLADQVDRRQAEFDSYLDGVDRFAHPDAQRIVPGWRGEPFLVSGCVSALFGMQLPEERPSAEEWEAA